MKLRKSYFAIFGITSFLSTIIAIGFYILNFKDFSISHNTSDWGNFGAYLSGTVASILSFLSFIALLITIHLQNRQQELSNKALLINERPWISMELRFAEVIAINNGRLLIEFEVTVENHGKTPALNLTFGTKLYNQFGIGLCDPSQYLNAALNGNAPNNVSVYLDAVFPTKKESFVVSVNLEIEELISNVKKDFEYENKTFPIYLHINSYITYKNILDQDIHITSQDGYIESKDTNGRRGMAVMIEMLKKPPKLKNDKITYTSGMPWHNGYIK